MKLHNHLLKADPRLSKLNWVAIVPSNEPGFLLGGTHHVPQNGVVQGGVSHHEVQGVGARYGVKLRPPFRHVQLKLVELLAVGLGHKHDLLAGLLVVQSDESLEEYKKDQNFKMSTEIPNCTLV